MMLTTALRTLCIGATLFSAAAQRGRDKKRNDDMDKCWTCEQTSGCFECLSISDNADGTSTVELDFSGCKDADNIGWSCCTGSHGPDDVFNRGDCEVQDCFGKDNMAIEAEGPKCEGVSSMFVMVPSDATSVVINTHDGRTGNDASPAVGADPMCAGREFQGGRCAKKGSGITSHCLETIDLSTCPTTNGSPMVPTSSPTLASELPSDVPTDMPNAMMASDLPTATEDDN